MLIHVQPKKLKKLVISATFEHQGVAYEEKFSSKKRFLSYLGRRRDTFVSAVDYELTKVINQFNLREYATP